MMTEFMALGNHRKSIRAEIATVTESVRKIQLDALVAKFGKNTRPIGDLSLPALQLLMSGLPKLLNLEKGIGVKSAHAEVTEAFERTSTPWSRGPKCRSESRIRVDVPPRARRERWRPCPDGA